MITLTTEQEARAAALHREALVIDTLSGEPTVFSPAMLARLDELVARQAPASDILAELDRMGTEALVRGELPEYWEWWDASGVDVISNTVGPFGRIPFSYASALEGLALLTRKFDALDRLAKVTRAADLERVNAEGTSGIILNFQNTTHFGLDLRALDLFYDLGVRIIQLTYNSRNFVGDGCTERTDGGLSHFGLALIRRMNEKGILIDCSHCGLRTTMEAIQASSVPVAITHSFSRELSPHDRGKTDEIMRALAAREGYFGILIVPFFITPEPTATLEHFLAHVDRAVDVMGADRVGIGTDWGATFPRPLEPLLDAEMLRFGFRPEHRTTWSARVEGYQSWRDWPNITRALVWRGYSDSEIRGLLGANFLRIFRTVVG
ncbi:MAG: membrane dipeptidase [Armatimonadetes bacterium]|nr:membrane dipeptidase [Armatimonadota bacterium]